MTRRWKCCYDSRDPSKTLCERQISRMWNIFLWAITDSLAQKNSNYYTTEFRYLRKVGGSNWYLLRLSTWLRHGHFQAYCYVARWYRNVVQEIFSEMRVKNTTSPCLKFICVKRAVALGRATRSSPNTRAASNCSRQQQWRKRTPLQSSTPILCSDTDRKAESPPWRMSCDNYGMRNSWTRFFPFHSNSSLYLKWVASRPLTTHLGFLLS